MVLVTHRHAHHQWQVACNTVDSLAYLYTTVCILGLLPERLVFQPCPGKQRPEQGHFW